MQRLRRLHDGRIEEIYGPIAFELADYGVRGMHAESLHVGGSWLPVSGDPLQQLAGEEFRV
jgi:hypothetical protein